jgi:copper chaperone
MKKHTLKLSECIALHAKPIIEKQLKDKKGIKKIHINNITNTVIVEFDPFTITKHDIKERLEESGYKFVRVAQY